MTRKIVWLSATVAALALLVGMANAMDPGGTAPAVYQVTMHYGGFGPDDQMTMPDIGVTDNLFRGTASARLELVGNHLFVYGSYGDLRGEILPDVAYGIHIHHDPALYHLETIVAGMENDGTSNGTFQGDVVLTFEQQTMLVQGRLYMDLHSTAFPEGELRGLILPVEAEAAASGSAATLGAR